MNKILTGSLIMNTKKASSYEEAFKRYVFKTLLLNEFKRSALSVFLNFYKVDTVAV